MRLLAIPLSFTFPPSVWTVAVVSGLPLSVCQPISTPPLPPTLLSSAAISQTVHPCITVLFQLAVCLTKANTPSPCPPYIRPGRLPCYSPPSVSPRSMCLRCLSQLCNLVSRLSVSPDRTRALCRLPHPTALLGSPSPEVHSNSTADSIQRRISLAWAQVAVIFHRQHNRKTLVLNRIPAAVR